MNIVHRRGGEEQRGMDVRRVGRLQPVNLLRALCMYVVHLII